jgi:hypothetical protein
MKISIFITFMRHINQLPNGSKKRDVILTRVNSGQNLSLIQKSFGMKALKKIRSQYLQELILERFHLLMLNLSKHYF